MARNVKWRMRFMAFDNVTQYTVSIYTEDMVSSVTELTGAANPFETQEKNDNNAFIPVRTSTGYLRFVVTDLSIINEIMCTKVDGRYVTLTKQVSGQPVIVWHGYMQTESFNCDWTATPYVVEFPIVSALGLLENMEYTPVKEYVPIGYIIQRALNNNYMDFAKFYTPYRNETHDFLTYLNDFTFQNKEHSDWINHMGYNADTTFPSEKRTCLSVISDICQYFGWSLYERGTELYFVSVNGTTTYQYGLFSSITQAGGLTIDGTVTASAQSLPNVRSTDNDREFLKGYGYFEISEKVESPADPVNFNINEAAPPSGASVLNGHNPRCFYVPYGDVLSGDIKAYEDKTGNIPDGSMYYGCQLAKAAAYTSNDWGSVQQDRDNFKPCVILRRGPEEKVARFESIRNISMRTFSRGVILSATIKRWNGSEWVNVEANNGIKYSLYWGDYCYAGQGSPWINQGTAKLIFATEANVNIYISTYWATYRNYYGKVKVYIYAPATDGNVSGETFLIENISLSAAYPNQSPLRSDIDYTQNLFRKTSGMGGSEVFTQENALCSALDDNQESDAMLMKSDLEAYTVQPEVDTVNRMQGMYGQPCEQVNVYVNGVDFTPFNRISYGNKQYFNASCNINWRDNKTKLQLQTLPT